MLSRGDSLTTWQPDPLGRIWLRIWLRRPLMRVLLVHPSPLMYSEVYLKLEPLGLERVAQALRAAGHEVRLLDLQIFSHRDYVRELDTFKPRAVGFSLNYLANVPEVLDLAVATRSRRPETFIFAGGP